MNDEKSENYCHKQKVKSALNKPKYIWLAILVMIAFLVLMFLSYDEKGVGLNRVTIPQSAEDTRTYKLPTVLTTPSISIMSGSEDEERSIVFKVPFTPQAPFGDWKDERQQDGCEEASALMAMQWARGQFLTLSDALREILAASEYERLKYGEFHDTSAEDTAERIIRGYFKYEGVEVRGDINTTDIVNELTRGNLVLIPVNGQLLHNPFFTQPGPYRHMLVVRGWDSSKKEFITNDPGTKRGEGYRYQEHIIQGALMNYETGHKVPVVEGKTAMIVIYPQK